MISELGAMWELDWRPTSNVGVGIDGQIWQVYQIVYQVIKW